MADVLSLLALDDERALRTLIQEQLKDPISARWLDLGAPQGGSDGDTTVPLTLHKGRTPVGQWHHSGSVPFLYKRYNLHDFISSLQLDLELDFPMTLHQILRLLFTKLGIGWREVEFPDRMVERSEAGQVNLTASSDSYRWVGSAELNLRQLVKSLSERIRETKLPGLKFPLRGIGRTDAKRTIVQSVESLNQFTLLKGLPVNEVDLINPRSQTNTEFNTVVDVYPAAGSPWKDSVTLHYNRLDLGEVFDYRSPLIIDDTVQTSRDLMQLVIDQYGLNLELGDILNEPLPSIGMREEHVVTVK